VKFFLWMMVFLCGAKSSKRDGHSISKVSPQPGEDLIYDIETFRSGKGGPVGAADFFVWKTLKRLWIDLCIPGHGLLLVASKSYP